MTLNRALGKVTVLVRGVARDFSQVHRSNSTLTLLLNGIPARITVDTDAVVQLCFDYLLILPTVFSLVRYTWRTALKVATPILLKILLCKIDKILHYQLTIIVNVNVGLDQVWSSLRADEIKLWLTPQFSYRLHAGQVWSHYRFYLLTNCCCLRARLFL